MFSRLFEKVRGLVFRRQTAYRKVFSGPWGDVVLADLADFCRARASTFNENPRLAANLDGRREVWLRIMDHLKLSPDELYETLSGEARDQSLRLHDTGEVDA